MIAQTQEDDFLLERMRFQSKVGYWMNDSLKNFLFTRAIQADSYEEYDLRQFETRIKEQGFIITEKQKEVKALKSIIDESTTVRTGQSVLLERANEALMKERRKRLVGKRVDRLIIIAAGVGGFLLGSR